MTAFEWLDTVNRDARFAARSFRRTPGFTAVVIITLALGLGVNTAIFSALHALLLRPLPFDHSEQLMNVSLTRSGNTTRGAGSSDAIVWSVPKFTMLRDQQRVFSELGIFGPDEVTIAGDTHAAERVEAEVVGGRYFETLRVRPIIGRSFLPEELDRAGAPATAIVSEGLWQRRFDASRAALGSTIDVDGHPHTIVGVMPSSFSGLTGRSQIWIPIAAEYPGDLTEAWNLSYAGVARLAPGVDAARAESAVRTIGARIDAATPYPIGHEQWGAAARPLDATRVDPAIRRSLFVLAGAVIIVLIITCANVAGLLIVRASRREREVAVRLAIGASRPRLIRQLVTESVLLSLAGGLLAIGLAAAGVRVLEALNPASTLRLQNLTGLGVVSFSRITLDATTLSFAAALAVITGLVFGLLPALRGTRPSLVEGLTTARRSKRHGGLTGRGLLSVVEIALAVVLLAGSGLMLRSLRNLLGVAPGFDASQVLTLRVNVSSDSSAKAATNDYYQRLLTSVSSLPGVTAAALASCPPLNGGCNRTWLELPDRAPVPAADRPIVSVHWVSPAWFATMRVPIVGGRTFGIADSRNTRRAVIVSQTAAAKWWPGRDPIGRPVRLGQGGFNNDTGVVVGVAGDVKYVSLDSPPAADMYLAYSQSQRPATVVFLRTAGDPNALRASVERAVRAVNVNVPAYDVRTMDDRAGDATAQARFGAVLLAVFAAISLLLATIGIYGVISTSVATRMREIGIRVALGATNAHVLRLALGEGVSFAVLGAVLGIVGAVAATRVLSALLFGVVPADPVTYAGTVAILGAATIAAAIAPARRAGRADPMRVLREE